MLSQVILVSKKTDLCFLGFFFFPSGSGPAKSGRLLCALLECLKCETFALHLEPFQNVNPRNYRFCLLWILARQLLEQGKGNEPERSF